MRKGRKNETREEYNARRREEYQNSAHRQKLKKNTRQQHIARNREYIRKVKSAGCCVDCGIKDWRVLDFDHVNLADKKLNVSRMARDAYSIEAIACEIAKCEIRCANCHRIRTAEQFEW